MEKPPAVDSGEANQVQPAALMTFDICRSACCCCQPMAASAPGRFLVL
jgi:hypothetical protein